MPTFRLRSSISLTLALFVLAPSAFAQEDAQAVAAQEASSTKASGKTKKRSKKVKKEAAQDGPVAYFAGFRKLPDGGTRVFVDLSERVQVTKRDGEQELTYTLKGARLGAKNNQNALVTEHFETPVSRARLVPKDDDLELVIQLREGTTPAHRILRRDGDSAQLQIDFPPVETKEKAKQDAPKR